MKKIIAVLLAVLTLFSVMTVATSAAEAEKQHSPKISDTLYRRLSALF